MYTSLKKRDLALASQGDTKSNHRAEEERAHVGAKKWQTARASGTACRSCEVSGYERYYCCCALVEGFSGFPWDLAGPMLIGAIVHLV